MGIKGVKVSIPTGLDAKLSLTVSICIITGTLAYYEDTTAVYAKLFFLLRKALLLEAQKPYSSSLDPITYIPHLWLAVQLSCQDFSTFSLGVYSAEQIFPITLCISILD